MYSFKAIHYEVLKATIVFFGRILGLPRVLTVNPTQWFHTESPFFDPSLEITARSDKRGSDSRNSNQLVVVVLRGVVLELFSLSKTENN